MTDHLLARRDVDAGELVRESPPRFTHPNKKLVHGLACPPGTKHQGRLGFSRWREMPLPSSVGAPRTILDAREGPYDYAPEKTLVSWHVNFADRNLFYAYHGALLAQDELQVAEHPALASVRELLVAKKETALTIEGGRPTPVLVTGVERRCALDTRELYGNRFALSSADAITRGTRVLSPPTVSNILAIAAPSGGHGIYRRAEIELILATAFTGFAAAKLESARLMPSPTVAIHTGFWGCGAFGGNRVLMAILQLLAARLAEIDRLVFHAFDRRGMAALEQARSILDPLAAQGARVSEVVRAIDALELAWGVSDGT